MDNNIKIMVADDDKNIGELISLYLKKDGYEIFYCENGQEVTENFEKESPNLLILDIMMPIKDGYQVLKEIREVSKVPVIMVTAKGETFDKVLGLELGADDYLVKPFDPLELSARVKAVLRRYDGEEKEDDTEILTVENLQINMTDYSLTYEETQMEIPPKELELLYFLASNPNRVYTREQLLDQIWGYDYVGETRTVDVHIKRLREKFEGKNSWEIKTVWGVGYKFKV